MSLTTVDIAKVKSIAQISAYFMLDGGIIAKIESCEEDGFYTRNSYEANLSATKIDYDMVNLTTDKFFKLTLVDPEEM